MMKRIIGVFGLLLAMSASAVTYEERFTDKAGKSYFEDPNVWVYTAEFAKRFGMPDKWIDNELKGAYAVAFRVEIFDARLKLPHKGKDVGVSNRYCILDVYLPTSAKLPWVADKERGEVDIPPKSTAYLTVQSEKDKAYKIEPVGFSFLGNPVMLKSVDGGFSTLTAIRFDRALYPGVIYLSFSRACTTPPKDRAWIEFRESRQSKKLYHRVDIPSTFMMKVYHAWEKRVQFPSAKEYRGVLISK